MTRIWYWLWDKNAGYCEDTNGAKVFALLAGGGALVIIWSVALWMVGL